MPVIGPRTMLTGLALVAFLAAVAWAYFLGRSHEANAHVREMLDLQEAYLEERDRADAEEAARLRVQIERDRLATELENAATTDPDAGRVSLPGRVLQRLNRF